VKAWRRLVLAGCALAVVGPAPALAQGGGTAPAYPGNTFKLERSEPIVAGTVVTVDMSGHAEWGEPTDATTISFDLSIFAQDADVSPTCEVSLSAQRQKSINLPGLSASGGFGGWVLDGDLSINPAPPATGIDWRGKSLPFSIRPGVRNVLLCGFQRYVIDDAAWYTLPVKVQQPRCRIVRRRLRCNVAGPISVRLKPARGRARTVTVRVGSSGTAKLPRRIRRGTYRATFRTGEIALGSQRRVRVR
jgi:hypothetical protein